MKSLAVFAHYDKDAIVDDYVVHYLAALKRFVDFIIFVSDCDLPLQQQDKLRGLADIMIVGRHGEYDFGSYKRGYFYARDHHWLDQYDELILCNDSCFAPVIPFDVMFENMRSKAVDFWGASINLYGLVRRRQEIHLQSFFLAFNRTVMRSDALHEFMRGITRQEDKADIINKYEIGLTRTLAEAGYTYASQARQYEGTGSVHFDKWRQFIQDDSVPFLKLGLVRSLTVDFAELAGAIDYDMNLIVTNTLRNVDLAEHKPNFSRRAKLVIYAILSRLLGGRARERVVRSRMKVVAERNNYLFLLPPSEKH